MYCYIEVKAYEERVVVYCGIISDMHSWSLTGLAGWFEYAGWQD
jgi:hypothetical protein